MVRGLFLVIASLILLLSNISLLEARPFHVVVDAGHGGRDHGAVNKKLYESEITLRVSHKIAQHLESDPRFKVTMTRTEDVFLSLERRAQIANESRADLFLSIHVNSSSDPRARGREIYFQNQLPPDEESLFLANRENQGLEVSEDFSRQQSDVANILEDLERNQRIRVSGKLTEFLESSWPKSRLVRSQPIRQAPFYVISNVNMPSALIEMGYLSNPQEKKNLINLEYQSQIAKSIYDGIILFKEYIDKSPSPSLN